MRLVVGIYISLHIEKIIDTFRTVIKNIGFIITTIKISTKFNKINIYYLNFKLLTYAQNLFDFIHVYHR